MKRFIGTKIVSAVAMNRQAYNDFRGWILPENENGADEGYLVEYLDGGKPNTNTHKGYVSWSPKEQFDNAYAADGKLTFGDAIHLLKQGKAVARAGWNGKNMYLSLIKGTAVQQAIADSYGDGGETFPVLDAIYMKTAMDELVPWLASQTDMLAEDWNEVYFGFAD